MSKETKSSNINSDGSTYTDDTKPRVPDSCIPGLLERLYGLKVTDMKNLPSYYDLNFYILVDNTYGNNHVTSVNKEGYVLKILNANESAQPDNVESQHELCKYLRRQGITTQIPILNTEGHEWSLETFTQSIGGKMTEFGPYLVRLLTFIPGKVFVDTPYIPVSLFNIGKFVGRLHKEIKGFHYNISENQTNVWTFHKTATLRALKHVLTCEADAKVVEEVVEAYEQNVLPKLVTFTEGVIHGDLSDQNLIVQEVPGQFDTPKDQRVHEVSALIDFAHISYMYTVFDIAVGIAYISLNCPDEKQIDVGGHILAGYNQSCSLNTEEFDALKILICVRLCQTLVYGAHTYTKQPGNDYILSTQKRGWRFLHRLWKISSKHLYARWKEIISHY